MSTNYVPETDQSTSDDSRRRSRRGGRSGSRSGGNRNNSSRRSGGGESRQSSPPPEPKKLSIVEKVASFLGFGAKEPLAPSRPPRSREELKATGSEGTRSNRSHGERSERGGRSNRDSARSEGGDRPARESRRGSGMRTPEIVEVTTPRLYIGNLSFDAGESDLFELFNGVGSVQNVEVVMNRQSGRPKGFAFVQMETVEDAKRAVDELHDKDYLGRKLVVSGAKASERRDERVREQAADTDTDTDAVSADTTDPAEEA